MSLCIALFITVGISVLLAGGIITLLEMFGGRYR